MSESGHTWSRTLAYHPHVHCVVTGGGLTPAGQWVASRRHLLLPVRPLGALFRGKFLHGLRKAADTGAIDLPDGPAWFRGLVDQLYRTRWHVYAKRTFGSARSRTMGSPSRLAETTPSPWRRWNSSGALCNTSCPAAS